jgi:hypothetical protein
MILPQYYARLDGPEPESGLDLVTPDMRFLLALPDRTIEGSDRDDLAAYIAGRNAAGLGRVHDVRVSAVHEDVEFHYGHVLEKGESKGVFLSAVHTTPDGLIDRYLNLFQRNLTLK